MSSKTSARRPTKRTAPPPVSVEAFLAALDHPLAPAILRLREIILAADPRIAEGIKWNVPSFRTTEYFATMNLREKAGLGVILHFGARKVDISTTGVVIADPDSLLAWLAKDRAMVVFRDLEDLEARRAAFTTLLRAWIAHV